MDGQTVIFDVDGTLVDTNYHHALAWFRTFRDHEVTVPIWRIHRAIGMGGDKLVAQVAGEEVEDKLGDELRKEWKVQYGPLIDEVVPFEGARELLTEVRRLGWRMTLASSGDPDHVRHYLGLLDLGEQEVEWTSAEDVSSTKPAPDLLQVALDRVGGDRAVLIGDSTWDCRAAVRADLPCVTVRTGGFGAAELLEAGARRVFDSLLEVRAALPELPFGRPHFQPAE
jgi:phosphoglycolate phosphatase-like HAD superfamily hydrolase